MAGMPARLAETVDAGLTLFKLNLAGLTEALIFNCNIVSISKSMIPIMLIMLANMWYRG